MIGMAICLDARELLAFGSTFSAVMSRAHDQIRMAAVGKANLRLSGSHTGVSIGQGGPSQMGLEDIALMRLLPEAPGLEAHRLDTVLGRRAIRPIARFSGIVPEDIEAPGGPTS